MAERLPTPAAPPDEAAPAPDEAGAPAAPAAVAGPAEGGGSGTAPGTGEAADEAAAWAEVEARWADPAAHRAYLDGRAGLAGAAGLDGLAVAGRRYRDALLSRPGDEVALAMKAEVLKRATVLGLAMLPRTAPPAAARRDWRRVAALLLAGWLTFAGAWLLWKLLTGPAT
jgi:hypothetical protein